MIIQYQGKSIEVDEVEPITSKENWNEYQLANGDILSIKAVLIRVSKAVTELSPDGTPLYTANTQVLVKVTPCPK